LWSWFSHKPEVQYGINARGKNVPRKIEGITIVFYMESNVNVHTSFFLACHAEVVGARQLVAAGAKKLHGTD